MPAFLAQLIISATYCVASGNDAGGTCPAAACDASCTLRQAITVASPNDTIVFEPNPGVLTITLTTTIDVNKKLLINGYSRGTPNSLPGGSDADIRVQLNGPNGQTALLLSADGVKVQGLSVTTSAGNAAIDVNGDDCEIVGNFIGLPAAGTSLGTAAQNGITVSAGAERTKIGTSAPSDRNLIAGASLREINVVGNDTDVNGNLIGFAKDGTVLATPATVGIRVGASPAVTGVVIRRNVVAGYDTAVDTQGASVSILSNLFGLDPSGSTAIAGSSVGVHIGADDTGQIGGSLLSERNVIGGHTTAGVVVDGNSILIENNFIGTNAAGTGAVPNATGITLNGVGHTVRRNLISGNSVNALVVNGSGTSITLNRVGTVVNGDAALPNGNGSTAVVSIQGSNNVVGGSDFTAANVISGNDGAGIAVGGGNNVVQRNLVGTDASGGIAIANTRGVDITSGTADVRFNIVAGNAGDGIRVTNTATNAVLLGNVVGVGLSMLPLPNDVGIRISGSAVRLGGINAADGNLISGNTSTGVIIASDTVQMFRNAIGTSADLLSAIPNGEGVRLIPGATGAQIGDGALMLSGNVIAHNTGAGITLAGAGDNNKIRRNLIFDNGIAIDLGDDGPTANDTDDIDTGPNTRQNTLVLSSAIRHDETLIQYAIDSAPSTTYAVEFYKSAACDDLEMLATEPFDIITAANGTFAAGILNAAVVAGDILTATVTGPNGTSEVSNCVTVLAPGTIAFSSATFSNAEGGPLQVTIARTNGDDTAVSVTLGVTGGNATDGNDYTVPPTTVTIPDGETSVTVDIAVNNDALPEMDETITLEISDPTNSALLGTQVTATATIVDDDCGNGRVDAGEGCEDGNDIDTDGCTNTCQLATCGDGIVYEDVEACDGVTTCGDEQTCAADCSACIDPVITPPAPTGATGMTGLGATTGTPEPPPEEMEPPFENAPQIPPRTGCWCGGTNDVDAAIPLIALVFLLRRRRR